MRITRRELFTAGGTLAASAACWASQAPSPLPQPLVPLNRRSTVSLIRGEDRRKNVFESLKAIDDQMTRAKTTLIEALINQELGEPFRRDAMKKPVEVAGISKADMRPQVV